ncbi:MAG: hypothetical protein SGI99_10490 [Pseudomonadota bacterium]|nr:hypothetical protein [Pseudomonadota bacterium]
MRSQFLTLAVALAAVTGAARAENALHFDGSNDRVTLPLPPVFSNSEASDFTIETWL